MEKNKFSKSEIISIVMSFVRNIENEQLYGIQDEELDIPYIVKEKINKLQNKDYEDFYNKIDEIAEEVYQYKTNELNELNTIHQEILSLINEKMKDYIIN